MVFFSRVGNRVESSESFQEARIMSSAEVVGAPAGDTGGTAIEVAVGKRGRKPLTGAERCRRTRLKKSAAAGGAAPQRRHREAQRVAVRRCPRPRARSCRISRCNFHAIQRVRLRMILPMTTRRLMEWRRPTSTYHLSKSFGVGTKGSA